MSTLTERVPPAVEVFLPPSGEERRLRRWLAPLTAPGTEVDRPGWRAARNVLVAPFTQLTFLNFDLQMFLFDVFHTTVWARVGHALGMTGVTLCALGLLCSVSPFVGVVAASLLLAWYAAMASSVRLAGWWLVMVGVVAGLLALADLFAGLAAPSLLLTGLLASGAVISLSHAFETHFPPRAGDPLRWLTFREYLLGPVEAPHRRAVTVRRLARVGGYAFIGWVNEIWASPRLLPYNVLRLMLAAGYAPALTATLDDRARRAWASGNPALDFVGIGGGAFLPSAKG